MKKYRIKTVEVVAVCDTYNNEETTSMPETICYVVQVKGTLFWHDVKEFVDFNDPDYAKQCAEELLEKLNEFC